MQARKFYKIEGFHSYTLDTKQKFDETEQNSIKSTSQKNIKVQESFLIDFGEKLKTVGKQEMEEPTKKLQCYIQIAVLGSMIFSSISLRKIFVTLQTYNSIYEGICANFDPIMIMHQKFKNSTKKIKLLINLLI